MVELEPMVWTTTTGQTIIVGNARFTGEDDGPTAGVREPRRPKPVLPAMAAEREPEDELV